MIDVNKETERSRDFELVSKYENMEGFVKYPRRGTIKSAGYDLFNNTGQDIIIPAGELSSAITTHFKAYMLDDEVLEIFVRSGHGFKYSVRLANSTGIVDSDYYNNPNNEGEIFVKLHNQGNDDLIIPNGVAMAQAIFKKYLITDTDNEYVGGDRIGGFGSTTKS